MVTGPAPAPRRRSPWLWAPTTSSLDSWQPEPDGPSLADFLLRTSTRFSRNSAAAAGKLAVATTAADGCRTHRSLAPSAYFSATIGAYDPSSGPNAWGILGTLALSETVPDSAVESLLAQQQDDGGWEWQPGFGADTNIDRVGRPGLDRRR